MLADYVWALRPLQARSPDLAYKTPTWHPAEEGAAQDPDNTEKKRGSAGFNGLKTLDMKIESLPTCGNQVMRGTVATGSRLPFFRSLHGGGPRASALFQTTYDTPDS